MIVSGNGKIQLLPFPFSQPAWSSDGTRVAFAGITPAGKRARLDLYGAAADGAGVKKLPGTRNGLDPVLSPDGLTLAFAREREREARWPHRGQVIGFRSVSIWLLGLESGAVSQLTPWRNDLFAYPSSFSPDGATLAITRERTKPRGKRRIAAVAMRLDGSGATVLVKTPSTRSIPPDGTRLALTTIGMPRTIRSKGESLTYSPTDLAVAAADGSGLTKLTQTRNLELLPSWDPSGQRLAYTLVSPALGRFVLPGEGDSSWRSTLTAAAGPRSCRCRGSSSTAPPGSPGRVARPARSPASAGARRGRGG